MTRLSRWVSIPHRYDPNESRKMIDETCIIVSIPHRYDPNPCSTIKPPTTFMFQFLIGTIQTILYKLMLNNQVDVSIPHRYDPNVNHPPGAMLPFCGFNSS